MSNRRWTSAFTVAAACAVLSGCTPAVVATSTAPRGKLVAAAAAASTYSQLSEAISKSSAARAYAAVYHAHWILAGAHHDVTGTAVVQGQRLLVNVSAAGVAFRFYQSGRLAYVDHHGKWIPTAPLQTTNLYVGYLNMVQRASLHHVPLRQLPQQFLGGEEDEVLQMQIPAGWLQALMPSSKAPPEPQGQTVKVTLYVGKQSHLLRFVQTDSVVAESHMNVAVTTNIEFYYDAAHTGLKSPVR